MTLSDTIGAPALIDPVPPEKPLSLFEFLRTSADNGMAAIPRAAYEQPIWALRFGPVRAFVVSDPAGVKQVLLDNVANYPKSPMEIRILGSAFGEGLLTSDGEKWRAHRRVMSPSFDHKSIVGYAPAMVETTERFLDKWDARPAGAVVNIADEMLDVTLGIISRTMFSTDAEGIGSLIGDTMKRGTEAMEFSLVDMLPIVGRWRLQGKFARIHRIFGELDGAIYKLIDARGKRLAGEAPDLLDRLIAVRDAETGLSLTNREVRDETVIIFLAGHETTAVAMTFVWYLLSQHAAVEAKLHREIDTVLQGRAPAYEDLARLPYTRMVIEEAMRLYPPAPALSNRRALADDTIGGHRVPRGSEVVVVPWVLHRHRLLWDDPERFEPERFSPERAAGRPRFAYLPFGGGPRICIGASLAMTEASLLLATMAQRYRLRLAQGQRIELRHRVTLRPKGGIQMVLERRC